jgi:nitrogen regulatory protein PII-like uncharacterized protein
LSLWPEKEKYTRSFEVEAASEEEAREIAERLARESLEAEGYTVADISVEEISLA